MAEMYLIGNTVNRTTKMLVQWHIMSIAVDPVRILPMRRPFFFCELDKTSPSDLLSQDLHLVSINYHNLQTAYMRFTDLPTNRPTEPTEISLN